MQLRANVCEDLREDSMESSDPAPGDGLDASTALVGGVADLDGLAPGSASTGGSALRAGANAVTEHSALSTERLLTGSTGRTFP